jgi:hypothetical protein
LVHGSADWKLDENNYTVEEVAIKARKFLFEEKFAALDPKPKAALEFWIGGYSSVARVMRSGRSSSTRATARGRSPHSLREKQVYSSADNRDRLAA